ncbi:MAG TPA: UTP--glucose-1-phosphate uridylyltransferase [Chthonomonadaceae bacterium]|nr:UTP--glucose-1-phosphate uridylyltransferase [Chthonomonadaceae bacterium]
MTGGLVEIITSADPAVRDRSLDEAVRGASLGELLAECELLEEFRDRSDSLYERVRACFFLYAIHRFHIPARPELPASGHLPFDSYLHLLDRRFEEAIRLLIKAQREQGPSDTLSSALAAAYHRLAFQTLADQVRRSVRSARGNQWMFRIGHPADQPLRIRPELLGLPNRPTPLSGTGREDIHRITSSLHQPLAPSAPVLREATPVRMDLTHCGWSDIFFLGMDYPEGARVLNVSIDLGVHGRDAETRPPVEAYLRVIDEPVLRLVSVDLGVSADLTELDEVFDFARDYLGLLKAALIASGIVPPGIEGSEQRLEELLTRLVGPGRGIELISCVNGIPKGSRLAVSTNLLASLIAVCMRATGQTAALEGALQEPERRLVAARAILGEWLAGSGGGWQDSGGVWPGIKRIEGVAAREGDPEHGISRGRLLPTHHVLTRAEASDETRARLQESLVLVHGGMAQNVGPILEMVTEKYLLRSQPEWTSRHEAQQVLADILAHLQEGDIAAIGAATTRNFFGPIQTIIPWASNLYTESLVDQVRAAFGADFWGFWMLGGMSGGGMGFIFDPARKAEAQERLQQIMSATRRRLEHALPFAMDPVVYDFAINERGTFATLLRAADMPLPPAYYTMVIPRLMRLDPRELTPSRRADLEAFGEACRTRPELGAAVHTLVERLLPEPVRTAKAGESLQDLLRENGFDAVQHERIRQDLRHGRIGLAQNRLPVSSDIRDAEPGDVFDAIRSVPEECVALGAEAIAAGRVAVVSLAAGVGSRWTQGAGVVKALHPFARLGGRHRTFVEVHLAKSRKAAADSELGIPHVFTTSYMTHAPMESYLAAESNYDYAAPLVLSPGRAIGLRMVPTVRDLRFLWEDMPQQVLDVQAQKMRESGHAALLDWARAAGEAADYTDNLPGQCLHPVGHWYEIPNMLKNGVLADLLDARPQLQHLLLHNIDTLGANVDPGVLGLHIRADAALSVEVIPRRLEDRGGGLARVNGQLRLVEGLAMPREEAEFALTYYNSMTTWIHIDRLLAAFGLTRATLRDEAAVTAGIRALAARMPTYVTIKEVKRRWGHGQEDVFPVTQFEKLWGDMTILPDIETRFIAVPRFRGQQLKEQAQLDGWLRDGSARYIEALCDWGTRR